jgi:antitoxin MazE
MAMDATLIKVGNSTSLRLAKPLLSKANLKAGDQVQLTVSKNGKIVIAPKRKKYTVEDMVRGMKPKRWQPLVNWGPPTGQEEW